MQLLLIFFSGLCSTWASVQYEKGVRVKGEGRSDWKIPSWWYTGRERILKYTRRQQVLLFFCWSITTECCIVKKNIVRETRRKLPLTSHQTVLWSCSNTITRLVSLLTLSVLFPHPWFPTSRCARWWSSSLTNSNTLYHKWLHRRLAVIQKIKLNH